MNKVAGVSILLVLLVACQKDLKHEKYVANISSDTLTVINPDFDTIYTILPGKSALIYAFQVKDTKQEKEDCRWLGDTLIIKNQLDSACTKFPSVEENWTWTVEGPEKERTQKCVFTVRDEDFNP